MAAHKAPGPRMAMRHFIGLKNGFPKMKPFEMSVSTRLAMHLASVENRSSIFPTSRGRSFTRFMILQVLPVEKTYVFFESLCEY